jgi:hypothetical protein
MTGMNAADAAELINSVVYKPEWTIQATPWIERHQDAVKIHFEYPAFNSSEPPEFPTKITARADFAILAGECPDPNTLLAKLAGILMMIEEHEMREFLRVGSAYDAPFHPHRTEGIDRWARMGHLHLGLSDRELRVSRDLLFGAI